MKFLVDAQLPARLAKYLQAEGHDAVHTTALPEGNRTSDDEVARVADAEDRVLVTKDGDFRDGHLIRGSPARLLIVATGNVSNTRLLALVEANLGALLEGLDAHRFVEFRHGDLILHTDR